MAGEPLIRVENLVKTYRTGEVSVHALRGISLAIERNEFVAIMGPSGSGKSTFMNILGFLDQPTEGEYVLDGMNGKELSGDELAEIRNQKIGFVFQGFNLLARTSALENVELPMIYAGTGSRERRARAREALEVVGLSGREHHHPAQLSGGEQQRVAIARALVNRPSIILADEPTGNLDSKTSEEVMALFQRLNQETGITILMITHEPDIASFAKREILFKDGQVIGDRKNLTRKVARAEE